MKVQANQNLGSYYKLEEGKVYDVKAILYFVTPFMQSIDNEYVPSHFINPLYSHGLLPNEVVYLIETTTATGRKTLARFLTTNFDVIDTRVGDNWSVGVINIAEEMQKVMSVISSEEATLLYQKHKDFNSTILVFGDKKFHNPEYLYDSCEDNL